MSLTDHARVTDAHAQVRALAHAAGDVPIYWGTGYSIRRPHVVASTLDAWSGEGVGYCVRVYPQGAASLVVPRTALRILAAWYGLITCYTFPAVEYRAYKQVVLFGERKLTPSGNELQAAPFGAWPSPTLNCRRCLTRTRPRQPAATLAGVV
jgi:hypothetical protein